MDIASCGVLLFGTGAFAIGATERNGFLGSPMLKGIHPCLSPDLLKTLAEMGHGDELVLADAHFPAHSVHSRVIRADGLGITTLLEGIMPLLALDTYAAPMAMMAAVPGDTLDPQVEKAYLAVMEKFHAGLRPERVERFAFYERARRAFAVVATGETRQYGNVILKKGVTPPYDRT